MLLMAGGLVGLAASLTATFLFEKFRRPRLTASVGTPADHPEGTHRFLHARVANFWARWWFRPFAAGHCSATIRRVVGGQVSLEVPGRWSSEPEPLIYGPPGSAPIPNPGAALTTQPTALLPNQVANLVVAIKLAGQPDCWLFNNQSYLYPNGCNPDWILGLGRHVLECAVDFDGGTQQFRFLLVNEGESLEDCWLEALA